MVLRRHWPDVPVFRDIGDLRPQPGFIDVVCGGFPCQPFSTAARGRNVKEDLWPEFLRVVSEAQPRWVVAENVPGIGAGGIERVSADLERQDFTVWPFRLDASLPQRQRGRDRVVWLAYANRQGEPWCPEHAEVASVPWLPRTIETNPGAVGMDDGLPNRMDRMRQLGNSICPQVTEAIARVIWKVELVNLTRAQ
jgi:DNA (cytosine-5)-methyltransferase 1